jgi:spore coat protein U-like protein
MKRACLIALLFATGTLLGGAASAATTLGGRMDVTATVLANCSLTVPPLTFGSYDPLAAHAAAPSDASTIVIVNCTRNTAASIGFDFGQHSPVSGQRVMRGPGADGLIYQIFRDAARSLTWAEGSEAVRFISRGLTNPERLTVFGRIPARQEVEPGAYTDVLTATVDF